MTNLLSPHFSLDELTLSETAVRLHLDNTPSDRALVNLRRTASVLEKIRARLGNKPISVSSGYRSKQVNTAVRGSSNSFHVLGLACDFICPSAGNPLQICKIIAASDIPFDQLIHEYGRWVHVGIAVEGTSPRRQLLTIDSKGVRIGLHEIR